MLGKWQTSLVVLFAACSVGRAQDDAAEEKAQRVYYERLLTEHKHETHGAGLLDFFRRRTPSPRDIEQIRAIIEQLHSPVYGTRVHADANLNKLAKLARPIVIAALADKHRPLETRRRLELLLKNNPEGDDPAVAEALAFFIAREKPHEAARVLLDYLPFAVNPRIVQAIGDALPHLALRGGKAHPAVAEALRDASALKRGMAGAALIRGGGVAQKPAIAHLLSDPHNEVRWQVLEALVEARDKEALPDVIDLLDELPRDRAAAAEELLWRVAGEKAPPICLGGRSPVAKVEAAWRQWWEMQKADVDLAKLGHATLVGCTLVTQMAPGAGLKGKVMELRPSKEVIWEIDDIRYPLDAQVVGPDRVLIAEYYGRRVTERDFKGNVHWEIEVGNPIGCQRLPGGDTFIITRRQLLLVDRDRKELFSHFHDGSSIAAAQRLRDGRMIVVDSSGHLTTLDAAGKVQGGFKVAQVYALGGSVEAQPGGRILVPAYRENRLVEYNWDGKEVWSLALPLPPVSASRLPGGNLLVVTQGKMQVIEIDRHGNEVWRLETEGRPWRARKR